MSTAASNPVVALLSQTLARRSQSTIRRTLVALGAKVHVANVKTDRLPPGTTHILLTEHVACPIFVLAIASASTVQLITPAFIEDCEKYNTFTPPHSDSHRPPDDSSSTAYLGASDILWIGRIWLGAYQFWRTRAQQGKGAPLYLHRVAVVGQTRPRGAARLLSPTSSFVKELLIAAGAQVSENVQSDVPTFAIVAPGLNRENSDVVASLLGSNVICLAPAFLLDLILRVSANPVEYLLFPFQKSLCATSLDAKLIFVQDPPLTVAVNISKQHSSPVPVQPESVVSSPPNIVQPANNNEKKPICCKLRISPAKKRESSESPLDSSPAKRKRSNRKIQSRQGRASVPPLYGSSIEIIDLTCSPKRTTSEDLPVNFHPSSSTRCVTEKYPTRSKRVRSNGPVSLGRSAQTLSNRDDPRPSNEGQSVHPVKRGQNSDKRNFNLPIHNGTESNSRTEGRDHSHLTSSENLLPKGVSEKRKGFRSKVSTANNAILKSADSSGDEFTQEPICDEAVNNQPVLSMAFSDCDAVHEELSREGDQSGSRSHLSDSTNTKAVKSHGNSSFLRGMNGLQNNKATLKSDAKVGNRSNSQVQGPSKTRGEGQALKSFSSKRCASASDIMISGEDNTKNYANNPVLPRSTRHQSIHSGSSSFHAKTSSTCHTLPTPFQRTQKSDDFSNYDLEADFDIVMASLGGELSGTTLKRMLKAINAPEGLWVDIKQDLPEAEGMSRQPCTHDSDAESDGVDNSPEALDESEFHSHDKDEGEALSQRKRREDYDESQSISLNVLNVRPPTTPVIVKNVTKRELVFLENADDFDRSVGHEDDDRTCQSSLSFADWLIAAENVEGFGPSEALASAQFDTESLSLKVWFSLLESKAFERLAIPGALNDCQIAHLVGLCARLVTCNFQPEMNSRLLGELLKLREIQRASKMDSLLSVIVSADPSSVPHRHRAVAAIWCIVLQSATWNSNVCTGWTLLDKIMEPLYEDAFVGDYISDLNLVGKKTTVLLETLWMITLTFSLRTDLFTAQSVVQSNDKSVLYPEHWKIFIHLFNKAQHLVSSTISNTKRSIKPLFKTILEFITEKFVGELWQVSEEFLTACTHMVKAICKLEKISCFCEDTTYTLFKRFGQHFHPERSKVDNSFRTECDYLFYFGWNFVKFGKGNKMKYVMNVMRIASPFTSCEGTDCQSRLCEVRHHVGLILSVADFVADHSDGEYQVCNILTVKSKGFATLLSSKGVNYSENEQIWESVMKGVIERCRTLTERGESGHVYIRWLLSAITEGLNLIKRVAGRRVDGTKGKEVLRAQESALWVGLKERFLGLKAIPQLWCDLETLDKVILNQYLNVVSGYASSFLTQIREWNSSTRISNVVGENKKKEEVVSDMVKFAATVIKMVSVAHLSQERNKDAFRSCGKDFSGIFCKENLNLIVNLMTGGPLVRQVEYRVKCREHCMDILGVFIDIFYVIGDVGWNETDSSVLKETLQKSGLEFLHHGAMAYACPSEPGNDPSVLVRFWWRAITKLSWLGETVKKDDHVKKNFVGVLVWIILQEGNLKRSGSDTVTEQMIREVRHAAQSLEGIGSLFDKWIGYGDLNGNQVYGSENAACVEQVIEHFASDWGRPGSITVANHLRHCALDMIKSKRRNNAEDGVYVAGTLFHLESQARGICVGSSASWVQERITDICDSIDFLRHGGSWQCGTIWEKGCETMLRSVFGGLAFAQRCEQNIELRVVVLRLVNAVGESNDLSGVWMVTGRRLLFEQGMSAPAKANLRGRIMENLRQWRELVLHGAVEDRLSCASQGGQRRVLALRRLLAAARVGQRQNDESLRRSVLAVVSRIQWNKRVESAVCCDGISRLLWKQICEAVGSRPHATHL